MHVARSPVVDAAGSLYGYELTFRPAEVARPDAAAAAITSVFGDHQGSDLFSDLRGYLTLPTEFLTGRLPLPFSPDTAIIQAPTTLACDQQVVAGLRDLADLGCLVGLDDFVWNPDLAPALQTAHVIKIEVQRQDWEQVLTSLDHASQAGAVALIATRVGSATLAQECLKAGFTHLQGPHLATGDDLRAQTTGPSRSTALHLLARLCDPGISVGAVQQILQTDAVLAHQVLRAANAAGTGLSRRIASLADAVMITGLDRLRAWTLALTLSPHGPTASLDHVLVRARTCQILAHDQNHLTSDTAFTLGLLSGLADCLATPTGRLVADLPILAPDLVDALSGLDTPLRRLLDTVVEYERYDPAAPGQPPPRLTELASAYLSALSWATTISRTTYGTDEG